MFGSWQRYVSFRIAVNIMQKQGFKFVPTQPKYLQRTLNSGSLCQLMQMRELHFSISSMRKKQKVHLKKVNDDEDGGGGGESAKAYSCEFIVRHGVEEMRSLEEIFLEELTKTLSLKVDLRTYENLVVKTEDGKQYKLNTLGRIKLVSPHLVSVDFTDNPSVIKPARLALEQLKLNITPRQEGATLYISIPRITRERRENLANVSSKKLLNDYKKALNEVYSKYDRELEDHEEIQKIMQELLKEKKALEKKAIMIIEERRAKLLTEVV